LTAKPLFVDVTFETVVPFGTILNEVEAESV